MKRVSLGLAALASVGCSYSAESSVLDKAADGYRWDGATKNINPVTINIVAHESIWSLRAAAAIWAPSLDAPILRGFSYMQKNGTCVIHIIDPEVNYQPEIIGHEVAHCAYGSFHSRTIGYK